MDKRTLIPSLSNGTLFCSAYSQIGASFFVLNDYIDSLLSLAPSQFSIKCSYPVRWEPAFPPLPPMSSFTIVRYFTIIRYFTLSRQMHHDSRSLLIPFNQIKFSGPSTMITAHPILSSMCLKSSLVELFADIVAHSCVFGTGCHFFSFFPYHLHLLNFKLS